MTASGVYQMIERRGLQAGVEVNPHKFRHTFSHNWHPTGHQETSRPPSPLDAALSSPSPNSVMIPAGVLVAVRAAGWAPAMRPDRKLPDRRRWSRRA